MYLGIAVLALLFTVFANADQPGRYDYRPQPAPIDQYEEVSPEQTLLCPPGTRMVAPHMPYPGPQIRMVPMQRMYSNDCSLRPVGNGFYEIWLSGYPRPIFSGYGPRVQAAMNHYLTTTPPICTRFY